MGILDFFKGSQYKEEVEELREKLQELKNEKLNVSQMTAIELQELIQEKKKQVSLLDSSINKLQLESTKLDEEINSKQMKLRMLEQNVTSISDEIEMESFGLYKPRYDFATSIGYKAKLDAVRTTQKQMINDKRAVNFFNDWAVDGSKAKGRKMNNDNIKLILRSFNNECEAAINKVKYNNLPTIEKRIQKSFDQLNKLNESVRISLTPHYLEEKLKELYLAYEYERKKQDEKEELREQRQREREEKALQKEIESQKKLIDKDITHYQNMTKELQEKLSLLNNSDDMRSITLQISELFAKIEEKEKEKEELDYRNAHASAGYVYIISNIGAFGKDVVKIGVTRRLEPLERISELSSASVPFKFDVHALIFSYDAYQLENDLHHYFNKYRMNKVNNRKEFFKVSIDDIEEKLKEYQDLTIDFNKEATAEEFRESMIIS